MQKFVTSAITLALVFFLCAAAYGIQYDRHANIADIPPEINWKIIVNANIWPDVFYSSSYSPSVSGSLHLDSYWTFEHSRYPFSGPVWMFHPSALDKSDVTFTANQITR